MAGEEGWARINSAAPGAGNDDPDRALADPEAGVKLGKVTKAVVLDDAVPDMTGRPTAESAAS